MKAKQRTFIYKNGEFVAEKPSAVEAAQYANVSPMVVKNIVSTNQKVTKKGWTFSYKPLSLDELEEIKRICAKRELAKQEKIEKVIEDTKNNKGVTMIELLGAMTILAILLGVAVPAISETLRKTRNQSYVDAAVKLISNAEYQFRKDNKLPKPTSSRCILMSLVYLNNGSFEEAPNGGDYTRNQSFVVARKDSTSGNVIYYVRLMEDMGDGEYRNMR